MRKKVKCIQWKPFVNKDPAEFQFTIEKPEVKISGGILGFGGTNQIWYTLKSNIV
jgi:hypothetical protein